MEGTLDPTRRARLRPNFLATLIRVAQCMRVGGSPRDSQRPCQLPTVLATCRKSHHRRSLT
eukprot:209473-Amphidinium_carterae.1